MQLSAQNLALNATAFFSQKATSQFEGNPGIYLSIGAKPDDNVCGPGLNMISSRQMKRHRAALVETSRRYTRAFPLRN